MNNVNARDCKSCTMEFWQSLRQWIKWDRCDGSADVRPWLYPHHRRHHRNSTILSSLVDNMWSRDCSCCCFCCCMAASLLLLLLVCWLLVARQLAQIPRYYRKKQKKRQTPGEEKLLDFSILRVPRTAKNNYSRGWSLWHFISLCCLWSNVLFERNSLLRNSTGWLFVSTACLVYWLRNDDFLALVCLFFILIF